MTVVLIKQVLLTKPGGSDVLKEYEEKRTISPATRKVMVNILVADMVQSEGRMHWGLLPCFPRSKIHMGRQDMVNKRLLMVDSQPKAKKKNQVPKEESRMELIKEDLDGSFSRLEFLEAKIEWQDKMIKDLEGERNFLREQDLGLKKKSTKGGSLSLPPFYNLGFFNFYKLKCSHMPNQFPPLTSADAALNSSVIVLLAAPL
ncbi:Inositol 145-trisphosphate receptor type 1 [Dissostichus eleginoides]|uniref:Inositol 145-trisphosphate receptor type 1 n=1 Tax=Dissostichus eleginoides TaxID=100907 RepID=A0AAD9B7S6_DISEL|nr:Inositol 145-trisphosphate receptor type 1 [Dissostichus eleginoides]